MLQGMLSGGTSRFCSMGLVMVVDPEPGFLPASPGGNESWIGSTQLQTRSRADLGLLTMLSFPLQLGAAPRGHPRALGSCPIFSCWINKAELCGQGLDKPWRIS